MILDMKLEMRCSSENSEMRHLKCRTHDKVWCSIIHLSDTELNLQEYKQWSLNDKSDNILSHHIIEKKNLIRKAIHSLCSFGCKFWVQMELTRQIGLSWNLSPLGLLRQLRAVANLSLLIYFLLSIKILIHVFSIVLLAFLEAKLRVTIGLENIFWNLVISFLVRTNKNQQLPY